MLFRLLGSLEATGDGVAADLGGHKQRIVLAALLLHPNEVVPIDRLIEWVWNGDPPRSAAHSIHIYVSELRKALQPIGAGDLIATREPGYVIRVPPGAIDLDRFEGLLQAADSHLQDGVAHEAAGCAREALDLWQGEPLADFAYDEFAQDEIRLLAERRLRAEIVLARAELDTGDHAAATARLEPLAERHPTDEHLYLLLMESLYRSGRTAQALGVFQGLRSRLGEQLGIEPTRALFDLEERILLHDPTLQSGPTQTATRNPFKGLRPFEEEDAGDFFGRTALIESVVAGLAEGRRFCSVVGPSGAGKSSVTRAGIIPALRDGAVAGSEAWSITLMTPGSEPLHALGSCLRLPSGPPGGDLTAIIPMLTDRARPRLLLVDQFEELFTLVEEEWVRESFLDILAEALAAPGTGFRLILTMRGDFYDRPLMYPGFGELFARSVVSIMPLTPAELNEAVAGPSQRVGAAVEPQLIAALVADVAGRSGALPLFQYSITELFNAKTTDTLTLDNYRALGGLEGALVGQAEQAYGGLTGSQQLSVRQVMLRLIRVGSGDTVALQRVPVSEISSLPIDAVDLHEVLGRFASLRLLTFDRSPGGTPTVEIAHEALLTTWKRLAEWIESNRGDLRRRATIASSIGAWMEAGEDPDYLPTGAQLEELERWSEKSDLALTDVERRYVDAARDRRVLEQEDRVFEAEGIRRLERRARWRLIGIIGLVILITGVALAAVVLLPEEKGPRVALIYDGRGDQSFGDLEAAGWDRAVRELTFRGEEIVPILDARGEILSAADAGADLIIGGGQLYTPGVTEAATEFPETHFAVIDDVVDLPNVTSFIFAHDQGSYLAGVAAGLASESGTIGFVGGMQMPLIEDFRAGFEAGVVSANPAAGVLTTFVGDSFASAFANPDGGRRAAEQLIEAGADVIYHAAGTSGWGVLDAVVTDAVTTGDQLWFIGVDVDQYLRTDEIARRYVLTSMTKRADVAIETAIRDFMAGTLEPGVRVLGLEDDGVALARSGGHIEAFEAELAVARRDLLNGSVTISPASGQILVVPGPGPPNLDLAATFDGETCALEGPSSVIPPARAHVAVDNTTDGTIFLAFVPITDPAIEFGDLDKRPEPASASDVPEYLNFRAILGHVADPGRTEFRLDLPSARYAVYCTAETAAGNAPILAAILEVTD